jgi:hypothetical protein
MAKTRKNHIGGKRATYNDISNWYVQSVQQAGYTILAEAHGYKGKVECYKKDLAHLKMAIISKIKVTKDPDTINDLKIMGNYIDIIIKHFA